MEETIIVKVGGEGGGITLFGRLGADGQLEFRRESADFSWSMLDEEEDGGSAASEGTPLPAPEPVWVKGWNDALALLDRNPWARLVPLTVHPAFREQVLVEVTRRLLVNPTPHNQRMMNRWLRVCGGQGVRG